MNKIKFFFAFFLLVWVLSACGKGVMDDTGGHSSNSAVNKNSLPGPEVANEQTAGSGTLNPYPANINSNVAPQPAASPATGFWLKAAQGGNAELELSRLAINNAEKPEVKQFAQTMLTDHSKANNEINALSTNKNVALPKTLDAKHEELRGKLSGLKGADFDKLYVSTMLQDHQEAVSLFSDAAKNEKDPDVKGWAAQTLPVLQGHLNMIKQIQANMGKSK